MFQILNEKRERQKKMKEEGVMKFNLLNEAKSKYMYDRAN